MTRVLLTGMSGTGKSTLIGARAARGYKAIKSATDEWSTGVTSAGHPDRPGSGAERDWVWRDDLCWPHCSSVRSRSGARALAGRPALR